MYVHTRERDSRPGFDGVKIKLLLLLLILYYYMNDKHLGIVRKHVPTFRMTI